MRGFQQQGWIIFFRARYFFQWTFECMALCGTLLLANSAGARAYLELGQPRLGFDMEVSWRHLQWLVGFFDARTPIVEDYVLSREAFWALPEDVRRTKPMAWSEAFIEAPRLRCEFELLGRGI